MRGKGREEVPAVGDPGQAVRLVYDLIPYLHCAPLVAGKRVLELGCGPGFGARHLARVAREVHAYDENPENIAWARAHQGAPAVFFRLAGEDPAPERRSYGSVLSLRALDRGQRARPHLRVLAGYVEEGGEVIVGVRNRRVPSAGIARSVRGLTPEELAALLRPVFGRVRILGVRGNAKVRAYREHRRRTGQQRPVTFRSRLAAWLPGGTSRDDRGAPMSRDASGPSPLAIDPDDFVVTEENLESAERLLAICAREPGAPT